MKINIRTKNITLTNELKIFIEDKIGSLKRFIDVLKKDEPKKTLSEVFFDIEKETKHHNKGEVYRSEAKLFFPGKKIMAKSSGDDLLMTVVEIKDKLQQEIKKYKEKNIAKNRRQPRLRS